MEAANERTVRRLVEEDGMGTTRRRRLGGDTVLQIGLALLGVILSALAWVLLLGVLAPYG